MGPVYASDCPEGGSVYVHIIRTKPYGRPVPRLLPSCWRGSSPLTPQPAGCADDSGYDDLRPSPSCGMFVAAV